MSKNNNIENESAKAISEEFLIVRLRGYTDITEDELDNETLMKMHKDSLLIENIQLEKAIKETRHGIINAYPFITKILETLNRTFNVKKPI